jgi:hypothetical protein
MSNQKEKDVKNPCKEARQSSQEMENMGLRVEAVEEGLPQSGSERIFAPSQDRSGSFVVRIGVSNIEDFMRNFRDLELRVESNIEMIWSSRAGGTTAGGTTAGGTTAGGTTAAGTLRGTPGGTTAGGTTAGGTTAAGTLRGTPGGTTAGGTTAGGTTAGGTTAGGTAAGNTAERIER